MKAGQSGAPMLLRFCKPVLEHVLAHAQETSGVMQGVMEDAKDACELVLGLADAGQGKSSQGIARVMASKGSTSTRALLRDIVLMTPYWSKMEVQFKQFSAARASFDPEMQKALGDLPLMSVEEVAKCAMRVPIWSDALPAGGSGDTCFHLPNESHDAL